MFGTEEEKLLQSFELLYELRQGKITYENFKKIVHNFACMWSTAIG